MEAWAVKTILLAFPLVPLIFLVYTLTHLEDLGITVTHPRVLVEAAWFVGLLVGAVYVVFW